jgi:hemerythrin-like metal-binding protein
MGFLDMRRPTRGSGRKTRATIRHLAVGHDAIDADHKVIVDCCNEIAQSTSAALEFQLRRLRSLLSNHFQNEELLLKQANSSLCDCHTRDHALFLELCDKAIDASREKQSLSRQLILRHLIPALREHIAFRDQLISLHLNLLKEDRPRPRKS